MHDTNQKNIKSIRYTILLLDYYIMKHRRIIVENFLHLRIVCPRKHCPGDRSGFFIS